MSNQNKTSGGVGFLGLLTLLFIGLKLTHNVDWSWFWVLSPILFGWGLFLVFVMVFGIIVALKE